MPTDVSTFSEVISAATQVVTDTGLTPFILASAVFGSAAMFIRKFKRAGA